MNEEPAPFTIADRQYVYIDDDSIASLQELIDFANANRSAFHRFRQTWGYMPTRTCQ